MDCAHVSFSISIRPAKLRGRIRGVGWLSRKVEASGAIETLGWRSAFVGKAPPMDRERSPRRWRAYAATDGWPPAPLPLCQRQTGDGAHVLGALEGAGIGAIFLA